MILKRIQKKNKSKKKEIPEEELKELKECFDLFDGKGIGKIDPEELKFSFESLGFDKDKEEFYKKICDLNTPTIKKKGGITFDEFVDLFYDDDDLEITDSKEDLRKVFDLFLKGTNSNVITFDILKKVSEELGENLTDDEIKDMLTRASKSGKLEVNFEEFYEIMTK